MRIFLWAIPGLLTLPLASALAVQPARHDVAWYRAHADMRASMLAMCQNDHSYDDAADCRNASSAAQAAAGDSQNPAEKGDPEANPAYYRHNAGILAMTLAQCSHGQAPEAWCEAAKAASYDATKR